MSSRHLFQTVVAELEAFWELVPDEAEEVLVVMEPTPVRRGARLVGTG